MPKITILGSCSFEPYVILAAPNKLDSELYEKDHEKAYDEAFKKLFKKAIEDCDFVFVYNPYGIGEHTKKDLEYAKKSGKHIVFYDPIMEKSPWDTREETVDKCPDCGGPATHPSGLCRDCYQSKQETEG